MGFFDFKAAMAQAQRRREEFDAQYQANLELLAEERRKRNRMEAIDGECVEIVEPKALPAPDLTMFHVEQPR